MDIRQFAKINGVVFSKCGPDWGGRVAYSEGDGRSRLCGFRTQRDAAEDWLSGLGLSEHGAAVLRKALESI